MDWQLKIRNNTNSPLNLGLFDSSNPATPITIISSNGQDYVDVPYSATYGIGDVFAVTIGGVIYSVTLATICTPQQVCDLLTNKGQGYWFASVEGGLNRFNFIPSGNGRLSSMNYTAVAGGGWTALGLFTVQVINCVFPFDANNIWACTLNGGIWYSSNGGSSWTQQITGVTLTDSFFSIFFINLAVGWCVGYDGAGAVFYTTVNGGANWTRGTLVSDYLSGVSFVDANNGWACAWSKFIWHTINGGGSWTQEALPSQLGFNFYGISAIDVNTAWACGNDQFGNPVIYATTDSGLTWNPQVDGFSAGTTVNSIYFIDANTGWACNNNGDIRKTTDGGTTWNPQVSGFAVGFGIMSIFFIDANNGWACNISGDIRYTTNGGTTWLPQTSGIVTGLRSIRFANALTGFSAGNIGKMLKTTTGGI